MRKINDLIADFSVKNIEKNLKLSPKELGQFEYDISGNNKIKNLEITDIEYKLKYIGDLKSNFILGIKRRFAAWATIVNETGTTTQFKEELVYEGRWHLRNDRNGEAEVLGTHPFSEYENVIWNLCKPENSRVSFSPDYSDFHIDEFPK
jgi:hypothetical protein